jgi:exopolysaccharide biosynthesis polyprenyl glycosylphosphotransferase
MISRVYHFNFFLRFLVYLLPLFAFGMSSYIRFGNAWFPYVNGIPPKDYLILFLFTESAWILATNHYKFSSVADLFWEHTGIRAAFVACSATFLLQTAMLVFVKQLTISRAFIFLSNTILFLLAVALRNIFRLASASLSGIRKREKILVVGTDQYARRSVKLLRHIPFFRCQIQAYLQLPGQPVLVQDAPVISTAELPSLEALSFDEVVVAIPGERYLQVSSVLDALQDFGKPIRSILDIGPRLSLREKVFQVGRLQMMNLGISPVESFAYTVLKRSFDLLFSSLCVVFLSPVLLALVVLVKLSSPGPILFRQQRVGRNGKLFTLLKFRTMRCSSTADSDTVWTTRNDPRCTAIGTTLRQLSLDELPQLFNVIRGDMSMVGPRPERPHFVAEFQRNFQKYNLRHCCQVGMTGWAQVHGLRGDTSISDRLQYDLYYVHNWSFGLDLQIIGRTMFAALRDENAY